MGLFRRKREPADAGTPADTGPSEIEQLRADLHAMRERLDDVTAQKAALDVQLLSITSRLDAPLPTPAPASRPAVEQRDVDLLRAQLARLDDRVAGVDERVSGVSEGITAVTEYITTVATELVNQISELGGEVDALAARPAEPPPAPAEVTIDEAALDELRDAQTRLANEQARYQIAFRQDLAELADRLRRPTT